jgi:hypothetical protein
MNRAVAGRHKGRNAVAATDGGVIGTRCRSICTLPLAVAKARVQF